MRNVSLSPLAVLLGACITALGCQPGSGSSSEDCNGTSGGSAYVDDCGRCVSGSTGQVACAQDCAGVWGGQASVDPCDRCVGGTTGETACAQDCAGTWGGQATMDHCGLCTGGTTGRAACPQDCAGVWDGTAVTDHCGRCVGGTTGQAACTQDCAGTWGGQASVDSCGQCVGGTTGRAACTQDCAGVWGGQASVDHCGQCAGGTTGQVACARDCAGVWGGLAVTDDCGRCVGGTTGQVACTQDCAGTWGGQASVDQCGQCTGGTTGRTACAQDCAGVWGGQATIDRCGQCVGGTTGQVACTQDCSGAWGGSAQRDTCNRCTGGATGREACGDGVCRLGPGETVQALVDNPGCAVVEVPAGYYGPIRIDIARMGGKRAVEVRGTSRDGTVFGGGLQAFRVEAQATLRLTDLTIRDNGLIDGWAGAAISNAGTVSVNRVVVSANKGKAYGVISNEGIMEIAASEISGNVTRPSSPTLGGAIYNAGSLSITGTSIVGNSILTDTGGYGAGIYNAGSLSVTGTSIVGNSILTHGDGYGAGICNDGAAVTLADSEVGNNLLSNEWHTGAVLEGGGIFSYYGDVRAERTSVHHNAIQNTGYAAQGGGLSAWGGVVTLSSDSDVSFNELTADSRVYGGGIYLNDEVQLRMDGATIQGNVGRARTDLGGAAVMAHQSSLFLGGNRLADNRLESTHERGYGQILGGVIYVEGGSLVMTGGQIVGNRMVDGNVDGGLVKMRDFDSATEAEDGIFLESVEIAGNTVTTRQHVNGGLISALRTLHVKGCEIHSNSVYSTSSPGGNGGLVYYQQIQDTPAPDGGAFVFEGTLVEGNTVTDDDYGIRGGLFFLRMDRAGAVVPTFTGSVFRANSVSSPGWINGGLFHFDQPRHVQITDCAVSENVVSSSGGTWPHGDSTIQGGLFMHGFSGWQDPDENGDVELVRSDVSGNRIGSAETEVVRGGVLGLYVPFHLDGRQFTYAATNATFSHNHVHATELTDGGLVNVFNKDGSAVVFTLSNGTVALNEIGGALGTVQDLDPGWVVKDPSHYRPVTVRLANSIVARNTATGGDCLLAGLFATTIISAGYNLLGDVATCDGLTTAGTDLLGLEPLFGVYGDHGGPVPALPVLSGSPAVDGGDPAGCTDAGGAPISADQRGLPRPAGPRCDIGAFEVQDL